MLVLGDMMYVLIFYKYCFKVHVKLHICYNKEKQLHDFKMHVLTDGAKALLSDDLSQQMMSLLLLFSEYQIRECNVKYGFSKFIVKMLRYIVNILLEKLYY